MGPSSIDEEWSFSTWRGRIRSIKLIYRLHAQAADESGPRAHETYRRVSCYARAFMSEIEHALLPLGHHLTTEDRDTAALEGSEMIQKGLRMVLEVGKILAKRAIGRKKGEFGGFKVENLREAYLATEALARDAEGNMKRIEMEMAGRSGREGRGRRRHRRGQSGQRAQGDGVPLLPRGDRPASNMARPPSVASSTYERVTIAPTVLTGHTTPPPIHPVPGHAARDFAHPPPLAQHRPTPGMHDTPHSIRPAGLAATAPYPDNLDLSIPEPTPSSSHQQPCAKSVTQSRVQPQLQAQNVEAGQSASPPAPEDHSRGAAVEYYDLSASMGEHRGRRELSEVGSQHPRQTVPRSIVAEEEVNHVALPEIHVEPAPDDIGREPRHSKACSGTASHRQPASITSSASSEHLRSPSKAHTHRSSLSDGARSRHDSLMEESNHPAAQSHVGSAKHSQAGSGVRAAPTATPASEPLRAASTVRYHSSRASSNIASHHLRPSESSKSKKSFWGRFTGRKDGASAVREGVPATRSQTVAWSFGSVREGKTLHGQPSRAYAAKPPGQPSRPPSEAQSRRRSHVNHGPKSYRSVGLPSTSSRISEPRSVLHATSTAASSTKGNRTNQNHKSHASTRSHQRDVERDPEPEAAQPDVTDHHSTPTSKAASDTAQSTTSPSNASHKAQSTSNQSYQSSTLSHKASHSGHHPPSTLGSTSSSRRAPSHHPSHHSRRTARSRPVSTILEEPTREEKCEREGEKEEVFPTIDMFGFQRRAPRRKKCHHPPSLVPSGGCESEVGTDSE